jgi:UDP-GlcNAc:undecaprenyl-phosphate/decaprenyl-phosphate GlcNAc-1-phosphate transferase
MERMGFRLFLYIPVLIMGGALLFPIVRSCFLEAGFRWLYMLIVSFSISFVLTPVFGVIAKRFNVMDNPDSRKLHVKATPLLGGAAVFCALIIAVMLNGICTKSICAILVSATLLFSVGVWDDVKEISAGLKMIVQLLACVMVMYCGVILRVLPDQLGVFAFAGNILLTLTWIVGITNALNFFDGMDGLAAGLAVVISFFFGLI